MPESKYIAEMTFETQNAIEELQCRGADICTLLK